MKNTLHTIKLWYSHFIHNFWREGSVSLAYPDRPEYVIVYENNPYIVQLVPVTSIHPNEVHEKIESKEWIPLNQDIKDIFFKKFKNYIPNVNTGCIIINANFNHDGVTFMKAGEGKLFIKEENPCDSSYDIYFKRKFKSFTNEIYFARLLVN